MTLSHQFPAPLSGGLFCATATITLLHYSTLIILRHSHHHHHHILHRHLPTTLLRRFHSTAWVYASLPPPPVLLCPAILLLVVPAMPHRPPPPPHRVTPRTHIPPSSATLACYYPARCVVWLPCSTLTLPRHPPPRAMPHRPHHHPASLSDPATSLCIVRLIRHHHLLPTIHTPSWPSLASITCAASPPLPALYCTAHHLLPRRTTTPAMPVMHLHRHADAQPCPDPAERVIGHHSGGRRPEITRKVDKEVGSYVFFSIIDLSGILWEIIRLSTMTSIRC